MHRLLLAASLLATLLSGAAQAAKPTLYTLDNGMEIVVLEDHRAPVVVHMVWYKVGAADEPPGKSGIAHFLEHLLFKGTDKLAPGELSSVVARNGGTDNAFTAWDYTAYHQRVAADRLELMMTMEADRMRNIRLTEAEVLTERNVILEERNQRIDNDPSGLFNEQVYAALYMNAPYGIPVIGWRHEMAELTREDALEMYRKYYAPNNAILVVAGDVYPEEVLALARKHYGPIEPTPGLTARVRPQEPPQLAERRITMTDPRVAQSYMVRNYLVPERDPGDQQAAAALTLLAQVLGGNAATSVLGRKLQFETRTAVYASAYYSGISLDDTGFGFVVVPSDGVTLAEAEAALDKAVAEFIEEGIDQGQWDRIRMQLRASEIYADDDITRQARNYGAALSIGLTAADVEAWPEILRNVTQEEVVDAARTLLERRRSVTGWLMTPETTQVLQ